MKLYLKERKHAEEISKEPPHEGQVGGDLLIFQPLAWKENKC